MTMLYPCGHPMAGDFPTCPHCHDQPAFKPCIHRSSGNPDHAICQAGEPAPFRVTPVTCAPCTFREEPKPAMNRELEKKMDDFFEPLDRVKCPHCNADRHSIIVLHCRGCGKIVGFGEGDQPGFREKYKHRRMVQMYLNKPPKVEGCNCEKLPPEPIPPWGRNAVELFRDPGFHPRYYPGDIYFPVLLHHEHPGGVCPHDGRGSCQPCGFRDIRKVRCPSNLGWNCEECPHAKPHTHLDRAWSIDDLTGNCRPFGSCPACVPIENEGEKKE